MRRSNGSIAPWSFVKSKKAVEAVVSGPLIAGDFATLLGAAIRGLGLAQVPGPIAAGAMKAGKLIPVLELFAPTTPGVFLYYPNRLQMLPKLRDLHRSREEPPGRNQYNPIESCGNTKQGTQIQMNAAVEVRSPSD